MQTQTTERAMTPSEFTELLKLNGQVIISQKELNALQSTDPLTDADDKLERLERISSFFWQTTFTSDFAQENIEAMAGLIHSEICAINKLMAQYRTANRGEV